MKTISLTNLIKSNWDEIQNDINNGMMLVDVFAKLENKYKISRARNTWYTTYNRYLKKLDADTSLQEAKKQSSQASIIDHKQTKKTEHHPNSKFAENPLLAATKQKNIKN